MHMTVLENAHNSMTKDIEAALSTRRCVQANQEKQLLENYHQKIFEKTDRKLGVIQISLKANKISRQESEKTTMFPMKIYRQNSPENPLKSAPMSLSKQFHSSQLRLRKGKPFPDDALSYQNNCFRSK